jgi:hypothetical protein
MIDLIQFPSTREPIEDYSLMMMGDEVMAVEIFVDSMAVMNVKNSPSSKWRLIPKPLFSIVMMLWFMKSTVLPGKGRTIKRLHQRAVFYLVSQRVLVIMIAIWNQSYREL